MAMPGGEMSSRPLHFIWMVDCSGSMYGEKIQMLNTAIKETIPDMRNVASENATAKVLVRVLKFSNGAQWQSATPIEVDKFNWTDIEAEGLTDMGKALTMVAEQLKTPPMPERALPPVLVLISDGQPTDDFNKGLELLMKEPWGKKAVRIAIAIGNDADKTVLSKFVNNVEIPVLEVHNPQDLVKYIRWASTVPLKAASQPASQTKDSQSTGNIPVPQPPTADIDADDVW